MSSDRSDSVPANLAERLLDGVGDAVFATWPDGTIFLWNHRAAELFGRPAEETEGVNVLSLTPSPDLASDAMEMLQTLRDGERWNGDVRFRRADGSKFPGRVSAAPALDDQGDLEAISFLVHDRTEDLRQQRRLQEHATALEHRNEQLRSLAIAAMHHFQEPVRDVVAHTQRIERALGKDLTPELEEAMTIVRDGAMRMRDLAQGLNRYAELADHAPQTETFPLGEVVEQVLAELGEEIDEHQATVLVDDLPVVQADREDLHAIFRELVRNAIAFRAETPPRIEISASRRDELEVVAVSDDGIGIDPVYHERIFRPFQRAHTYDERPGVGLGLTIARELVEASGGSMWVDSEEGEGATFYVALPASEGEEGSGVSNGETTRPLLREPEGTDLFTS